MYGLPHELLGIPYSQIQSIHPVLFVSKMGLDSDTGVYCHLASSLFLRE